MSPLSLPSVLGRASITDFESFSDIAVIELIASENPTTLQVAKTLCDVYKPETILLSKEGRRIVLEFMTADELTEFFTQAELPPEDDIHDFASNYRFNSEAEDRFLSFFALERPVIEEQEEALELKEQCAQIQPSYGLFSHQLTAAKKVSAILKEDGGRVLLHMPTGSGKTRTAMHIISGHFNDELAVNESSLVFWLADSEELCAQAADEFAKAWDSLGLAEKTVNRFFGQYSCQLEDLNEGLVVASLQKLNSAFKNQGQRNQILDRSSLVVFDEAHRILAPTYASIVGQLTVFGASLLGLTATPGRSTHDEEQNRKFADYFDSNKVILEVEGYGSPIHYLQAEGYLSEVEYMPLTLDGPEATFTGAELELLRQGNDFDHEMLKRLGEDTKRNIQIIMRTMAILERGLPTILFACSIAHSRALTALLKYKGVKVGLIIGATPPAERAQLIEGYKNGTIQVLINYGVLTTGFDAPKTAAVVITRPTTSLSLYSQMVGRATRGEKVGGTKLCEVHTVLDDALPAFTNIAHSFTHWDRNF